MQILLITASALTFALTGCALTSTAAPLAEPVAAIQGVVHGGQQPVSGAHVYLFAAGTSGYGGNGIAASSSNASVSVLTAAATGQSDSVGPYVVTTSLGNFTFPGYSCTPGTQIYAYVLGGNPGGGTNSALGLMAALGACPSAGNLNTSVPYISINEVSTIVAAYSLAGFASDATHISSSGTALAQTGIANAFVNATNLASIATGAPYATTPTANGGNGTVPHDEILTLANILAYCVNSNDANSTISTNCSTLFGYALSGGTTGTTPTDTATAVINIAHNPGSNVANLYALDAAMTPYTTTSSYSQPNDWTIALRFTGSTIDYSTGIAIDASGNAWVSNMYFSETVEFSNTGRVLSGTSGYSAGGTSESGVAISPSGSIWISDASNTNVSELNSSGSGITVAASAADGGMDDPNAVAIDASGQVWVTSYNDARVTLISSSGNLNSGTRGYAVEAGPIAIDGSGNGWIAYLGGNNVTKVSPGGTTLGNYTATGLVYPNAIAIDSGGNAWIVGYTSSNAFYLVKLSNSGSVLSGPGFTGGGLRFPGAVAIDGAGYVWTASSPSLNEFTPLGVPVTPSTGYTGGQTMESPKGVAVDGSGDVWFVNAGYNNMLEFIGAAAPVITPIAAGLPTTVTSNGTSSLGTRP